MFLCRKHALNPARILAGLAIAVPVEAQAGEDPYGKPVREPVGFASASQGDPFAVPSLEANADYDVLFLSATVDGRRLGRLLRLRQAAAGWEISIDSAITAMLLPMTADRSAEWVRLSDLEGVTSDVDTAAQHVTFRTSRNTARTTIDLISKPRETDAVHPLTAAYLAYDAAVTADETGVHAAALLGANVSRLNVQAFSNWRVGQRLNGSRAVHLETAVIVRMPERRSQVVAGDLLTGSTGATRSLRMTGLQYATNFRLQPDLVTTPLPAFSGDVAVPTKIDLLLNDRRYALGDVAEGAFDIRNIPVQPGRNAIAVVVADELGRERVENIDFYTSRTMLAPGLASFSLSLGRVRRNYGRDSFDYGAAAVSGTFRRGMTPRLTVGGSAEMSRRMQNVGVEAEAAIASFARATIEARTSLCECRDGDRRTGFLIGGGIESFGGPVYYRLSGRHVTDGYEDLASVNDGAPTNSQVFGLIGFDLRRAGRLSLTAAAEWFGEDARYRIRRPNTRVTSVRYGGRVGRFALFGDISHRWSGAYRLFPRRSEVIATAGLSLLFGARTSSSVLASVRDNGRWRAEASLNKPTIQPGDVGYNLQASVGEFERVRGLVKWERTDTIVGAEASLTQDGIAARANASGALVLTGGSFFATRPVEGGMLLVDAKGVGGVEVQRDNRRAGTTRSDGKFLLTNLPAYVPTKISIDPASVPADATMSDSRRDVSLARGTVSYLDLGVSRFVSQSLRLTESSGAVVPAGSEALAYPSGERYIVGFDGEIDINAALADDRIEIDLAGRGKCIAYLPAQGEGSTVQDLRCESRVLARQLNDKDAVLQFFTEEW